MCGVGHRTISILLVSVFVKNFEIENGRTEKHRNHPLSVSVFVTPFDIKVGAFCQQVPYLALSLRCTSINGSV